MWAMTFNFKGANNNLFSGRFTLIKYFSVKPIAIYTFLHLPNTFSFHNNKYQCLLLRCSKQCAPYFIVGKGLVADHF